MPEISLFLGIIISMNFNEHNPLYFHVRYNDFKALIEIKTSRVLDGRLPGKVLGLVIEWSELHQKELLHNWDEIRSSGKFDKIKPLI